MQTVYFDSSVFLAIFKGEASSYSIRELLAELKRDKVKIYTSIITVQEVSVQPYRKGTPVEDRCAKVDKLARIEGVTKDVALTAAKFEAHVKDQANASEQEENKRRKWDCFHIATAVVLKCSAFYSMDDGQLRRRGQFNIHTLLHCRNGDSHDCDADPRIWGLYRSTGTTFDFPSVILLCKKLKRLNLFPCVCQRHNLV